MNINEIFQLENAADIITNLKEKSVDIPQWYDLLKDYEPRLHDIMTNKVTRKSKGDGEEPARIPVGMERLLVKRMTEFMFSPQSPVKRKYSGIDDQQRLKDVSQAIDAIYKTARIDNENLKRGENYFASCEFCTVWYAVKKPNKSYGFETNYKLKCKTYSPMDGTKLYPLFDEYGDMLAMSFEYRRKVKDEWITFFETYTDNTHYKWQEDGGGWLNVTNDPIKLMKIPCVYAYRHKPLWEGLQPLRHELEYTLSRNSDTIAYNASPILKVVGALTGEEAKGEGRRIFRVNNGGDVSYVSWSQAIDAIKYQVEEMIRLYFMQSQVPDISFENLKGLGGIGYDARQMYLSDISFKVGDESGAFIEAFEREGNIIKAYLKILNPKWKDDLDNLNISYKISAYIPNDEDAVVNRLQKANGGKALMSHRESIAEYGRSADPEATMSEIRQDQVEQVALQQSLMGNNG